MKTSPASCSATTMYDVRLLQHSRRRSNWRMTTSRSSPLQRITIRVKKSRVHSRLAALSPGTTFPSTFRFSDCCRRLRSASQRVRPRAKSSTPCRPEFSQGSQTLQVRSQPPQLSWPLSTSRRVLSHQQNSEYRRQLCWALPRHLFSPQRLLRRPRFTLPRLRLGSGLPLSSSQS